MTSTVIVAGTILLSLSGRHAGFDRDRTSALVGDGEARVLERRLDVHAIVDDIRHELRMRQRLIRAAHNAESDMQVAALHELPGLAAEFGPQGVAVNAFIPIVGEDEAHALQRGRLRERIGARHEAGEHDDERGNPVFADNQAEKKEKK